MRGACFLVMVACSGDPAQAPDGPPSSELTVTLLSPNGGEMLVPAEASTIRWSALAADVTAELQLIDSAGASSPIAAGLLVTAGQEGSFAWTPVGVPAPTEYKVRVSITDQAGGVSSDESDATLTVSPPTTGVSLAADLGPMFDARCNTQICHNTATQASSLDLSLGKAHAQLVGIKSKHTACASFDRVVPGSPQTSFLIFKLQGNGACFAGVRMPKGMPALSAAELQQVRDWISEGANNN